MPPRRRRPPPFGGLVLGLALFCVSLTPSLVPRSWLVQGLVTGVSTAIGYGTGVLLTHLPRQVPVREPGPRAKRLAWRTLAVLGPLTAVAFVVLAGRWQQRLHLRMGAEDPTQPAYLAVLVVAAAVTLALVALARLLRLAARAVGTRLARRLPPRTSALLGVAVVTLIVAAVGQGVVLRGLLTIADQSFRAIDETVSSEVPEPQSHLRSGGPGSTVAWEELGSQGRAFVHRAVSIDELEEFGERAVAEPIRVYTGLDVAADADERAAIAVAELERTGAFDREVLCVASATGTGWVNPVAAAALEHLHGGDTAIVSMQYSYLPSWLSFLVDRERAAEAGRALFEAVHARWEELPSDDRPRLVVYGESLGSYAAESAFDSVEDLRERTNGALFVGPTESNPLRRDLLRQRDPDTPAHLPVVDDGRHVRFAAATGDLDRPDGSWRRPRVAYLQHASDPIVWWSPSLILRRPDWLAEPRGDDVLDEMRWFPLVTFWQLTADLARAGEVPPGYGHDYGARVVDGWAAVVPPAGWGEADTQRLRRQLDLASGRPPSTDQARGR